jgi:hypothetical protein
MVVAVTLEESAESILCRYSAVRPYSVEEIQQVLSLNCGVVGLTMSKTAEVLDVLVGEAKAVKVDGGYVAGPQARQQ